MDKLPEETTPDTLMELILEAQLESSPSGITVVDIHEQVVFWNKRFLELWRLTDEDLSDPGRNAVIEKVINRVKNAEEFQKTLADAYSDLGYQGTDIVKFRDGTHIERKTVSLRDMEGRYHGRIWYFTDITQHKEDGASPG